MKIDVYSNMHNEERILPYWLRHYETIADRIFVWDDDSTDGTRKILKAHPKVKILPIAKHNSNDDYWTEFVFPQYKKHSRGHADWVIVADADEFIYHPNLREVLKDAKEKGIQVIQCRGFSMVSDTFPVTTGQIYDEVTRGLPDKMESKWTIHSPDVDIRFAKGRHGHVWNHRAFVRSRETGIKLFHYRFLGPEYLEAHNQKLFERHTLMNKAIGVPSKIGVHRCPDGSRGSLLEWFLAHKGEAVNVVDDFMNEYSRADFWRGTMYTLLKKRLIRENIKGEGVEFGGSNGVIQGMFPEVKWETRTFPPYDVTKDSSFERDWDVIVVDQILEHVQKPWEAMRLIGEHTKQMAIITVPFLIGIHPSPHDYWRMTPRTINDFTKAYFKSSEFGSWGTSKANYWHSIYNRTSTLFANIPEEEIAHELAGNEPKKPFVIWAILKK